VRTIVIGDIHGCSKALQGLLEVIQPRSDDCLVFLGDYVDRGPDSRGVIDLLLDLQRSCRTVYLLGNHEIMFRGALRGLDPELWLQIGGSPTLTSYGGLLKHVHQEHLDFLDALVPYHETEQHIFVHANYVETLPINEQPEQALFWEHLTDRVPGQHCSGKHVFCGHSPQPRGEIGAFGHFTCLDTGCVSGYWLSAIDVDTQEVWQVSREGHLRQQWRLLKKAWISCKNSLKRYRS
jgi:serine/threonine protein phosphatase 1